MPFTREECAAMRKRVILSTVADSRFLDCDDIENLLAVVSGLNTADRGDRDHFLSETERLLESHFRLGSAKFIHRVENEWRYWGDTDCALPKRVRQLCASFEHKRDNGAMRSGQFVVFPVVDGTISLVVNLIDGEPFEDSAMEICARFVETTIRRSLPDYVTRLRLDVTNAFKRVANTILKSQDLPEIFFNITQVAQTELSADICGIMLLEDDWLVMQRCVGNMASATSRLKMRAGQGVGGRVLETGKPYSVENYVQSADISHDFFDLARAENVRSALAVPLFSDHRIIGVLEVWRRRPSTFSVENTAELSALADLASVAIENAYLNAAQSKAVSELRAAHETIKERYDIVESSAEFQAELVNCVLQNEGLDKIATLACEHLLSTVLILDQGLNIRARAGDFNPSARELDWISRELLKLPPDKMDRTDITISPDLQLTCQRLSTVTGQHGWAVVVNLPAGDERARLALVSISTTIALLRMKERAAASALSEKLSTLLWDLVQAPESLRQLALQRLRESRIELEPPLGLMLSKIEFAGSAPKSAEQERREESFRSRLNQDFIRNSQKSKNPLRLMSFRGNEIVAILSWDELGGPSGFAAKFSTEAENAIPGAVCTTGVSGKCLDPIMLPKALKEARLALNISKITAANTPIEYNSMGLLGIIFGLREGTDFRDFAANILQKLSGSDQQAQSLRKTLATYFDADCNKSSTAMALRVHPKTVAYRLERIEEETGLDLKSHDNRVLLSLAMQLHEFGIQDLRI